LVKIFKGFDPKALRIPPDAAKLKQANFLLAKFTKSGIHDNNFCIEPLQKFQVALYKIEPRMPDDQASNVYWIILIFSKESVDNSFDVPLDEEIRY
jgi:MinD superfamily P-loop ATPase